MNLGNIIFFYPSKIVGGAEYMFIRIARQLANMGHSVYYIDYIDGFSRKELENDPVHFINYEDQQKTRVTLSGTLITPVSNFYRITDYLIIDDLNLKIIFWSLHILNVLHVLPEWPIVSKIKFEYIKYFLRFFSKDTYKTVKELLFFINKHKAYLSIDEPNSTFIGNVFEIALDKNYVPIPISEKSRKVQGQHFNNKEVNIAIISRLCNDKIHSVINVLENLYQWETNKKINCHIIGEGVAKRKINIKKYQEKINIVFTSTLINENLRQYLLDEIDVLCAMGTASLEAASLGIPTILISYKHKPYLLNQFNWIFNATEYNLGFLNAKANKNIIPFSSLMDTIYIEQKKEEIGKKCYDYCMKNHSIQNCVILLINKIMESDLYFTAYLLMKESLPPIKRSGIFKFFNYIKLGFKKCFSS